MKIEGSAALVTGAARGIGKAIAVELAARGADLVLAGRTVEPKAHAPGTLGETAKMIEGMGRKAVMVKTDVSRQEDLDRLAEQALAAFGRIDILVNNAAVTARNIYAGVYELTREQLDWTTAVNVTAPFMLTKLITPHMRQGEGIVINMTSGSADFVDVTTQAEGTWEPKISYGVTKAALNRLTNAVARELYPLGIPVIAINPGVTKTELLERAMAAESYKGDRVPHPVDWPAKLIAYLCAADDALRYSGTVLEVEEGFMKELGIL